MELGSVLGLMLVGLIAGAVARFVIPGRDRMGLLGTMALGVIGSFVGGTLGALLSGTRFGDIALQPAGILGSILGSIIALLIWRRMS